MTIPMVGALTRLHKTTSQLLGRRHSNAVTGNNAAPLHCVHRHFELIDCVVERMQW